MHNHKIGLIFVAIIAFALAGCGASAASVSPLASVAVVSAETSATHPVPVIEMYPLDPTSFIGATAEPNPPRDVHEAPACSGLGSRNRGTCWFILVSTGEKFGGKSEALAAARKQKLADRRVEEVCFKRDQLVAVR